MKYSMYNVVWYDGVDAYATKFVLPENEKEAKKDIGIWWEKGGWSGEILKLDKLYGMALENIIALRNENDEQINTFNYFEEMYF